MAEKGDSPHYMKPGIFITIEGTEGCGKSIQARLLASFFKKRGWTVVHTREPGGTRIAEAVRRILLHPGGRVSPLTELFLYEAARAQHLAEVVRPALQKGKTVICERYTDSTEAYQGWGRGLSLSSIRDLNRIATGNLIPNLTLLLDVPLREGLLRARALSKKMSVRGRRFNGGDRLERESLSFHRKVRLGYHAVARRNRGRVRVIPWRKGPMNVHQIVVSIVEKFLCRD